MGNDIDPFKPTETQIANYWVNSKYLAMPRMGALTVVSLTNRLAGAFNERDKARFEQTKVGATTLDEPNGDS